MKNVLIEKTKKLTFLQEMLAFLFSLSTHLQVLTLINHCALHLYKQEV